MNITQIRLVTLPVADQDRAKEFYEKKLGFAVVGDMTMGPMRWLEVAPEGSAPTFVLLPGLPGLEPGGLQGVQLETTDIVADCTALREVGVNVDGPHDRPWGRDATFSDPDGNGFVLITPATAPSSSRRA